MYNTDDIKVKLRTLAIILVISQGCVNVKTDLYQYSSSNDTLKIETYKQKGSGPFSISVSPCYFADTFEEFSYSIVLPEKIRDVRRMQWMTDYRAEAKHYIDIVNGRVGGQQIFIVDQNNNKDLTDDSIRVYSPIDWDSEENLIECRYSISRQGVIVEDTSWLRLGLYYDELWCGKSEHLIAEFSIDEENFRVGIAAPRIGDFTYSYSPEVAVISHNSYMLDTLNERDILKKGEILILKDNYYRFDNISYYGDLLTLVKENDFDKLVGIQVGMIAPEFTCLSVAGDTIHSTSLHDKILIIANSCGCGGDKHSTEAYYEILDEFGEKIHIVRLDSKIDKSLEGNHVDMENDFNKDIYNKYRDAYCSRICYVVDKNNRLIDKFPISEWEQFLPRLVKE